MKHFLSPYPCDTLPNSKPNASNAADLRSNEQKPTIRVLKKDGQYTITMNPLKTKEQMKNSNDPYADESPIKFRITQDAELVKTHHAKKLLQERGFDWRCNCTDLKDCCCMSEKKKVDFLCELLKISRELDMKNTLCAEDLANCSDSELDVEFTPPSALIHGAAKRVPDISVAETQYKISDFLLEPSKDLMQPKTAIGRVSGIPVKIVRKKGGEEVADSKKDFTKNTLQDVKDSKDSKKLKDEAKNTKVLSGSSNLKTKLIEKPVGVKSKEDPAKPSGGPKAKTSDLGKPKDDKIKPKLGESKDKDNIASSKLKANVGAVTTKLGAKALPSKIADKPAAKEVSKPESKLQGKQAAKEIPRPGTFTKDTKSAIPTPAKGIAKKTEGRKV